MAPVRTMTTKTVAHWSTENCRHDVGDDITQTKNETANDDSQGDVAFVEQLIKVEFRSQPIKGNVTDHDEQDGYDSKRDRREEIAQEIVREMKLHRVFRSG